MSAIQLPHTIVHLSRSLQNFLGQEHLLGQTTAVIVVTRLVLLHHGVHKLVHSSETRCEVFELHDKPQLPLQHLLFDFAQFATRLIGMLLLLQRRQLFMLISLHVLNLSLDLLLLIVSKLNHF